ncbi:aldose 1-epimerase [Filimonas zeae]|uniref:Aldose epimerase n=1 Tax=Filimonas zeae TaxID=1737353 RepID=A0A917J2R1_9BACT|nr:aldose 1-epimerase [Filimonas zeae]MDR6341108.1 aldose 1-epimerase [Filimonas zeae]GGH77196.1 aldose epimerase [Filimonas zeae]
MAFDIHVSGNGADQAIVLQDTTSGTYAEVYCVGALLNKFALPFQGNPFNVVEGFSSPAEALADITNGFKSAKLSPFTCRMNKGEYTFQEQSYKIEKFYLPPHAIHGIIYDAVYTVTDTRANDNEASVTLQYQYTGTDKGFPFPYQVTVKWQLQAGNKLTVATTLQHQNEQAIPLADGWHPYFTLDVPVDACSLYFTSDTQLEFDETLIPTGKRLADNRFANIPASLDGVFLDNCFEIDKHTAKPVCVYSSKNLKLTIAPDASYPYFQIYTPPHRQSIAIENLSAPPDAFNNKIALHYAEKNTPYQYTTTYIIETV